MAVTCRQIGLEDIENTYFYKDIENMYMWLQKGVLIIANCHPVGGLHSQYNHIFNIFPVTGC